MLKILTGEEELENRKITFKKIESFSLIDLGQKHYYIVFEKIDITNTLNCLELTPENIKKIYSGDFINERDIVRLSFDDLKCLNYHSLK